MGTRARRFVPYVTALPPGPVNGQEVFYAADATNGVIWHLRYRSAPTTNSLLTEMLADSPTSLWKSDETSGTSAADVQSANAGTYVGGPTLGATRLVSDGGTAVNYPGNTVHTEETLPGPVLNVNGAIVILFKWSGGTAIMRDNTSAAGSGWIIGFDNAGTFTVRVATTDLATSKTTAQVRDGNRHILVVSKTGAQTDIYLDGVSIATGAASPNTAASMPWHVARNGTNTTDASYATATVDYIAMYPAALSAARVTAYSDALALTNTSGWEFIGGPPLQVYDVNSVTHASSTFTDFSTAGPSLTMPLAGDYMVEWTCNVGNTLTAPTFDAYVGIKNAATNPNDADCLHWTFTSTQGSLVGRDDAEPMGVMRRKITVAAANDVLKMVGRSSGAQTINQERRLIVATPVKVS
jgi:hypothetical protein